MVAIHADYEPSRYTVDLGMDPEHRWDHIVADQKEMFVRAIDTVFNSTAVKPLVPAAKLLVGNALEAWRILGTEQYLEIKGIARELGMDASYIVLLPTFYDVFAAHNSPLQQKACTGIIAQSSSGEIFHGRNLDYDFKDAIGPITIVVDFARNNRTLFTAVSFGPTPAFNTAVRHGSFSITQNERDTGSILTNIWDILVKGRTATFATIRNAVETIDTFEGAVKYLSEAELSAASYFIVAGTKPQEGVVITRGRDAVVDVWRMDPSKGDWYVLELNSDRMYPAPFGDNRRAPLQRALNATGPAHINASNLWDILSIRHVNSSAGERSPYNDDTIYTTVMQASNPNTFKTLVRGHRKQLYEAVIV